MNFFRKSDKSPQIRLLLKVKSWHRSSGHAEGGWLYLAAVMELFSRKIIGWAMVPNMAADLFTLALRMAIAQPRPPAGLLLHSDRGSQYLSLEYQSLLDQRRIRCSMSRKGDCRDKRRDGAFLSELKMERVWHRDYTDHAEAKQDIPITS